MIVKITKNDGDNTRVKSKHAQVEFNDSGTPVATHFDDVYFSNDSGIDETQHVFIEGNDLPSRWLTWEKPTFVIAETGFGTGLNFLVAMHAFNAFKAANPNHPLKRLFFITTEKFPLPQHDMQRALSAFPALKLEADALSAKYPMGLEGCHRLDFPEYSTTLDLWMGDVHELLPQWHCPLNGLIDAWFLDGFAPSKNPDMWTDALFSQMARLSKSGTTFGTFTAAGIVKRGLAAVGFTIKKRNGFGRKRDMLTGVFDDANEHVPTKLRAPQGPYYRYSNKVNVNTDTVIVVGSGLGAASTCLSLVKRGIKTTLCFDGHTPATGASGNPQGGFYPQLHSEASIASRLQAHSFLYARQCYDDVLRFQPDVPHAFCGVIQLSFNEKVATRQTKLGASEIWPDALVRLIDEDEVSQKANLSLPYSGLWIEQGGWLSPPSLVSAMIAQAEATGLLEVKTNHRYISHTEVSHIDESVKSTSEKQPLRVLFELGSDTEATTISEQAKAKNGQEDAITEASSQVTLCASHLILALGAGAVTSDTFASLPLRPVRGQVEAIPTQAPISALSTVLCHKGYMTPAMNQRHALGSTYVKNDLSTVVREEETHTNLLTHEQALENTSLLAELQHDGEARAATRLGSPDHQPVVGALHNFDVLKDGYSDLGQGKPLQQSPLLPGSYVSTLTCLGSRGLTTAPLMAEVLVSSLCDEPLPLNNDLLNAVNTSRFMTRQAIRGE